MSVQHHRTPGTPRTDDREPPGKIVVKLAPAFDIPAPTTRSAHPPVVVRLDVEARPGHLVADVLVPAGVFAETMDQQDRRPRRSSPGAAGLCLIGRPLADEKIRTV